MRGRLLKANEIDVKVKQVSEKGAILLLYKNARTDMNILDELYGPGNWTNEYKEIGGVLFCGIGLRNSSNEPFVWKWSNGIESREDSGNEKKGEASDAFKRAGFMVGGGIGRELYTAPFIFVNAETEKDSKGRWKLKDPFAKYDVKEIEYNEDCTIKNVVIVDKTGNVVFGGKKAVKKPTTPKAEDFDTTPEEKQKKTVPDIIDENVLYDIEAAAKATVGFTNALRWIEKKFGKDKFELLSTDEANKLLAAMKKSENKNIA